MMVSIVSSLKNKKPEEKTPSEPLKRLMIYEACVLWFSD